jgi:Na+-translocating ferredoxin:NAD+ oxidoreductase RnfG subunit
VPDVAALKAAGLAVPPGYAPKAWLARSGEALQGWVLFDRVVGKYELIDYAAGFNPQGQLTGVEVLVYRESHGAEIRTPAWRRQFEGRKGPSQVRFGDDIRNISGATLSCQHVTEGVQRLSALAQGLVQAREGH